MKYIIIALGAAAIAGVGLFGLASSWYFFKHSYPGLNRQPAWDQFGQQGDGDDQGGQGKNQKQCNQVTTTLSNPPTQVLECVFHAPGFAESTITYNPSAGTATTVTGNPPTSQTYTDVTVGTGDPPYGNNGLTMIVFGDVPIFSVMQDSGDGYFLATWGTVPGGPAGVQNAGVCNVRGDFCSCQDFNASDGSRHCCARHRFGHDMDNDQDRRW